MQWKKGDLKVGENQHLAIYPEKKFREPYIYIYISWFWNAFDFTINGHDFSIFYAELYLISEG